MTYYDKSSAECLVFTHKEGLLSAVGHDLEIKVTRLEVDVDHDKRHVRARFETASLEVVAAMVDGEPRPGVLSADDKHKIEEAIRTEVLQARSYPDVRFISSSVAREGDGYKITGEVTMHGKTRPIAVTTRSEADRQVAEIELDQRDFGMKPYTAMLGALKVKPIIKVRVSIPNGRP